MKTRTLFRVFFRDERNNAARFPQFSRLRLFILQLVNFSINRNSGCYILPSLKDIVPEISKLRRMHILPSKQPSTQTIKHWHPLSLKFLMLYEHMQKVCVYVPYLMYEHMQTMIVPCIHYVCERTLSTHTIST